MTEHAQEWRLVRRPKGYPVAGDVELVEVDVPEPRPGEVLVRNAYVSVDPYMRGRMNDAASYAAPYQLGKAMWGGAVGHVLASEDERFPVGAAVRPGVTTDELDAVVHAACIERGGYPSPLGYNGFPKSLCTSINEVICHGIPDSTALADGDIVNCDVTIFLDGVHGDTNATFLVGEVDEPSRRLVEVTRECLEVGIAAVRPGGTVRDIGQAIQAYAEGLGYGVVRSFVGHGIGRTFHAEPQVYHYDNPAARMVLEPGMTFTIEPMITVGDHRHDLWADGWTAVTKDRSRTAQFEHTLAVTDTGSEVLTRLEP